MLDERLTEQPNPRSRRVDLLSPLEITDLINAEDRMVAQAVGEEREAIAHAMSLVVDAFRKGGRLIYVGAGTSGRLRAFHRALEARGIARDFDGRVEAWSYAPLAEADRAAAEVERHLLALTR